MENRLIEVQLVPHRLDPAEVELRLAVTPQTLNQGTRIQGRLMGPRSPYANTVEIAYPWREMTRTAHQILLRTIIPEASFWDPETPFLYEGPLELWQDEVRVDHRSLSHGLRHLRLGWPNLRINGKAWCLRGVVRDSLTEAEARKLQGNGVTLIFSRKPQTSLHLWQTANRFGMMVIAEGFWEPLNLEVALQPSALGRMIQAEEIGSGPALIGVEADQIALWPRAGFVLGDPDIAASARLQKLLRLEWVEQFPPEEKADGVLGWLQRG